ncbi:F-box/kelch-repeat protein At1g23390-like [Zingiber officinale]|uniref:F-box domain-containing protein n=1 Tax=Zingiber officinale TaxID=94328 RepID=A0A8J5HL40_ZINOF|nr:F-box/kelch-repeat protein At1g23390-like [Zingiber officinale]KAG6518736.1 hypothetical protein ZIOFF_022217 [Zingiber officinale]
MDPKTAWHGAEEEQGIEENADRVLHGDVLDAVVARVSALDLLPASCVSKQWRAAVLAAARQSPRRGAPWLVLRVHGGRKPVVHAFNPISRNWRSVALPSGGPFAGRDGSAVHVSNFPCSAGGGSTGGAGIYALSSTRIALAADLFGTTWRELEPLRSWRTDPVVALVGRRLVVAGGASELLEDDPASVEVWEGGSGGWAPSDPMPAAFQWSPAISAAASERRLYTVEKQPPFSASWFDPEAKRWGPTSRLQIPDPTVRHVSVAFACGRLLLATVSDDGGGRLDWRPQAVRLWAMDQETLEVEAEQVAQMPQEMVAALVDEDGCGMRSLGFLSSERFAYLYNPLFMKFFFLCEIDEGGSGGCRWEAVPRSPSADDRPMHRVLFSCTQVNADESGPTKF